MLGSRSRWRLAVGVTVGSVLLSTAPALAATKPPAVKVVVTSRPTFVTATGSSAHPIDRVVVKGRVTPASGRVVLQRAGGRRWVDLTGVRVGKTGAFTLVGQRVPLGRQTLRVVRAAVGKVKAVASASFVVTVRAPQVVAQPQPPAAHPTPVPAPPPAPAAPVDAPPVTPTCQTPSAGGPLSLQAYTMSFLGYAGRPFSSVVQTFNADSAWRVSGAVGALPPGITQSGGTFSGVPQLAGVYRFSVTVSEDSGSSVTLPLCFQFVAPLHVTTTMLPAATVGQPYDQPLPLAGGFLPLNLDYSSAAELAVDGFTVGQPFDLRFNPTAPGTRTVSLLFTDFRNEYIPLAVTMPVGPLPGDPRTLHVPGDVGTVQAAIDLARPGDSVLVAPGTYHGDVDFHGKAVAVRSSGGPSVTTLVGSGTRAVVSFHHEESRDAVIDGFTIRGGSGVNSVDSGNGSYAGEGGGVDIKFASPTIEHDVIVDNSGGSGAGLSAASGSPVIRSNDIAGNTAVVSNAFGGALFLGGTYDAQVIGNTLENTDWRYGEGGGAWINGTGLLFADNVIRGNWVRGDSNGEGAAGLFVSGSPGMRIVDDLVTGNVGMDAVTVAGDDQPFLLDGLTIADNSGIGLFLGDEYGQVVVKNTVVSGTPTPIGCGTTTGLPNRSQPATFDHVDSAGAAVPAVCGSWSPEAGDTTAVPAFGPGGYVPAAGSALVDAGATDPAAPATDLAGNPRVVDGNHDGAAAVDIGALERQ